MNRFFFIICVSLGFVAFGVQGQDKLTQALKEISVNNISLETVQAMVSDSNGVYFYPKLVEQFEQAPQKMLNTDFLMLYYGFMFMESYDPFAHFALEDSLSALNEQARHQEALELANELLLANPVSIFGNIEKAIALNGLSEKAQGLDSSAYLQQSFEYLERYRILVETMERAGVGSNYEKPIVLITPKDAQAILRRYRLTELSKTLNGQGDRLYDVYLVRNPQEQQYPIYFDITVANLIGMAKLQDRLPQD
ncbi:MAG: DUF4919 domain-containing protein [Microscillaceae bacterium]|nr:DUF4919 domain-containing protein [Microscillaceae bacterium]